VASRPGLQVNPDARLTAAAQAQLRPLAGHDPQWGEVAAGVTGSQSPAASDALRNRSAFPTTDTDDRLIASAAIIGLSSNPKAG